MSAYVAIGYVEGAAVKEISQEEGGLRLTPSSTMFQLKAVWMSSYDLLPVVSTR